MLLERFPELHELNDQEKLNLADELTDAVVARREAAVQAQVRECLAAYRDDPAAVVTWEQVKASLQPARRDG